MTGSLSSVGWYDGILDADRPPHSYRDRDPGVRVLSLSVPGPATAAGLRKDDIITSADGTAVSSMAGLIVHARERDPGNPIVLEVLRNERPISITLTLPGS